MQQQIPPPNKSALDVFEISASLVGQEQKALMNILEDMQGEKDVLKEHRVAIFNILEDINSSQEELKQKYKELDVIKSLTQKLGLTLELKTVMKHIIDSLQTLFPKHTIAYIVAPIETKKAISTSIYVYTPNAIGPRYLEALKESFKLGFSTVPSLQENKTLWQEWVKSSIKFEFLAGKEDATLQEIPKSQINIPIAVPGAIAGIINLSALESGVFQQKNIDIAHTIINSAAQTIKRLKILVTSEHSRLQDLVESMSNVVIMFDASEQIIVANPIAKKTLNITDYDLSLKSVLNTLRQGKVTAKNGSNIDELYIMAKKEGKTQKIDSLELNNRYYEALITPVRDLQKEVSGGAIILHDITHIAEIDRMKTEFVSIASHELRTPLTAIDGIISMIRDGEYGPIGENLKQPLEDVNTSSERLIHLVNDLLNLSRLESGRLKITLSDFPIAEVINEGVKLLQPIAVKRGLQLIASNIGAETVYADKDKVNEILGNLVGNALKFTDKGSITVSTKVVDDTLEIDVADTGIGITQEDQSKLFGQFQQLESGKGRPTGTGLGLYISRKMARKMGGDLWIEKSELGKGSSFAFSIPISQSPLAIKVKKEIEAETKVNPDQKSDTIQVDKKVS